MGEGGVGRVGWVGIFLHAPTRVSVPVEVVSEFLELFIIPTTTFFFLLLWLNKARKRKVQ